MKCEQCGANLKIEHQFCPYCGTSNREYKLHRDKMQDIHADYEKTKDEVMKKTKRAARISVRITLIAVLVAVNLIFFILGANMWSFMRRREEVKIRSNVEEYRRILEELEKKKSYILLSHYNDIYPFYGIDELDEYEAVLRACGSYKYIYEGFMDLHRENDYLPIEDKVEMLSDNLDYFYESVRQDEYEDKRMFEGSHGEAMEEMKDDVFVLAVTYAGLTKEEALDLPKMSKGERQVILERGIMNGKH